eukprot:TRINITY_DN3132_c0_g1_i1.p1 TRINITY_DN3132_c0_g1~~TRINITY_DN3132_c0_g1_i1.p1  ORF type:complete len:875 (+),score=212.77 TRINITY_DN3132_c0_g1_i1:446-3070(+)
MEKGGRYRQRRWETSSAYHDFENARDRDFRAGRWSYQRGDFRHEMVPQETRSRLPHERGLYEMHPNSWSRYDDDFDRYDRFHNEDFHDPKYHHGFERSGWSSRYSDEEYDTRSRSHTSTGQRYERDDESSRHDDHVSGSSQKRRSHSSHKRERELKKRSRSRDLDRSGEKRKCSDRSRSISYEDYSRSPSRSPRGYIHGRGHKEGSIEGSYHKTRSEKLRDSESRHSYNSMKVSPSATLVVRGLTQKMTEDDLYQAMANWGPLKHVRIIRERSSGLSRGFAFVDFPSIEAAQKMMDEVGDHGLKVDGCNIFFEYSSKPTGGIGGPQSRQLSSAGSNHGSYKGSSLGFDWICNVCGYINFARRTLCFQCNESRTEDSLPADMVSSYALSTGKKNGEPGPTHVLVVRGLDEHIDEEMLHYEFSKHAPIKDLRLVRDKFTHVSRGFAFVHFHSVEEATRVLEATNGMTLEKNGSALRVAYAKNVLGPGSMASASTQASNLAAAAIEAATFAQQYNSVGQAPKDQDGAKLMQQNYVASEANNNIGISDSSAPQSGFIWDEASGYYYDAASGFYYDANSGLYYDGNNGVWYSYNSETQQYTPYGDQCVGTNATSDNNGAASDALETAPPSEETLSASEKKPSLPEAVQAAAIAAMAASKKDKEKLREKEREIKLASKNSILASKKKISNVLNMWKQRQNESEAPGATLNGTIQIGHATLADDKLSVGSSSGIGSSTEISGTIKAQVEEASFWKTEIKSNGSSTTTVITPSACLTSDSLSTQRGIDNQAGNTLSSKFKESGNSSMNFPDSSSTRASELSGVLQVTSNAPENATNAHSGSRRRFSETPQTVYRDRAAERRSLYASSKSVDEPFDIDFKEKG